MVPGSAQKKPAAPPDPRKNSMLSSPSPLHVPSLQHWPLGGRGALAGRRGLFLRRTGVGTVGVAAREERAGRSTLLPVLCAGAARSVPRRGLFFSPKPVDALGAAMVP